MMSSVLRRVVFVVLSCAVASRAAHAQASQQAAGIDVGSETENRLRVGQLLGEVPLYPWTIRGFSAREHTLLLTPPPGKVLRDDIPRGSSGTRDGILWQALPLETRVIYNSAFPYGFNDGSVWAGRGVTGVVQGGFAVRRGVLSLQLEPLVFQTQNEAFPLMTTGRTGVGQFANGFNASIDLPQRFGNQGYGRFDPGQSTLRVDAGSFAAAISTANQFWGPAVDNPIVLGDNASGFPHAFVGTSEPVGIGIGKVHGRIVWGRLDQSASSPQRGFGSRRFMSGIVGTFLPRGVKGLEIGGSRFYHTPWPKDGFIHAPFLKPLGPIYKRAFSRSDNLTGTDTLDNQIASIFARWVLPASGLEIYGEYGKEDHNQDAHDLEQEPDHDAAYLLGFQRAWQRSTSTVALRGELLNSRIGHITQSRPESPFYIHPADIVQGHTVLGQLLGAEGGFGGGAASLALDRYSSTGRWTVRLGRLMRGERRVDIDKGVTVPSASDVMQTLGFEQVLYRRALEIETGATAIWDMNRNFQGDVFSMNLVAVVRAHW